MRLSFLVLAVAVLVLAACGTSSGTARPAEHTTTAGATSSTITPTPTRTPTARVVSPTKVLVVMEENHSLTEMRQGMPFLRSVSDTYGYATDWKAIRHPSEPNYLAIAGGSTFGVTDDRPPVDNAPDVGRARSVFSQALAREKTAGIYAESMPHPCALANSGEYAVRHNPWTFFAGERSACRSFDRSTAGFAAAAKADRLPDVGFLIPNLLHDAHDGTLAQADSWLRSKLKPVLASADFRSGRLVVVVTADEDDNHSGNTVLTSVLASHVHHRVVRTRLTHYSLTRFIDRVIGASPLRAARTAPRLDTAFGL